MATSNIKENIDSDIHKVWEIVLAVEPYKHWEFDMENSNMRGHWVGVFTALGNKTQIDFTEKVIPKNLIMMPFVKSYLKKQQSQFVIDLKKALER